MVLLELAIGKGAVLAGLAKTGSLGAAGKGAAGTGAAAALLAPAHGLWETLLVLPAHTLESISACGQHASSIASGAMLALAELERSTLGATTSVLPALSFESISACGQHVSSMASGAMLALTEIERTSLGVATTSVGLFGLMHASGFFSTSAQDEASQEQGGEEALRERPSRIVVPMAIRFCSAVDCCMAGVVVHSVGQFLAVPLRTWALGGFLLSFPLSCFVRKIVKSSGYRYGFIVESAAVAAAFAWLSWGTSLLMQFPQGMHTAPLLWWSVFGQCVLVWSCLSVAVSAMILTTVFALMPPGTCSPSSSSSSP